MSSLLKPPMINNLTDDEILRIADRSSPIVKELCERLEYHQYHKKSIDALELELEDSIEHSEEIREKAILFKDVLVEIIKIASVDEHQEISVIYSIPDFSCIQAELMFSI